MPPEVIRQPCPSCKDDSSPALDAIKLHRFGLTGREPLAAARWHPRDAEHGQAPDNLTCESSSR